MKKLLLIVHHRLNRAPGQRFRIEQFLESLKNAGYEVIVSNIISESDDKKFYAHGKYLFKTWFVVKSFCHRIKDIRTAQKCDLVFIYREAYMLGTNIFERLLAKTKTPVIFDFDDSIWLNDTSEGNQNLAWLKRPEKAGNTCKYVDLVTVGNQYLYDYAKQFSKNVFIIPTVINTDYHNPDNCKHPHEGICIGWTGTQTTLKHYETIVPALKRIKEKYGDKVYFKIIVNCITWSTELPVNIIQWKASTEIYDLQEFDIGIMPLPDDKWSRRKCGFKGLQCMALNMPVVMSPVGVNSEIITDGENGFLATSEDEWFDKLSMLIDSAELRGKLGSEGRKTVEERYSVNAWKDIVVKEFCELKKQD